MSARLTAVHEHYRKKRYNHRVIFGSPMRYVRRGWRSRLAIFEAGQVFGYERWLADKYGTQHWIMVIGRAVQGGAFATLSGIKPGLDIWVRVTGKTKVKRLLAIIDVLKSAGHAPENVSEHRWRHLGLMLGPKDDPAQEIASWSC